MRRFFTLLLALPTAASAATLDVQVGEGGDYATIQDAIDSTAGQDLAIALTDGKHAGFKLNDARTVQITGVGPDTTVVGRVLINHPDAALTLGKLGLQDWQRSGQPHVVAVEAGSLTVDLAHIAGDGTEAHSAVYAAPGARLSLDSTVINGFGAGGVEARSATVSLSRVSLFDLEADSGAGAYLLGCESTLADVSFDNTRAMSFGGAIYAEGGTIAGLNVSIRTANANLGAGLFLDGARAAFTDLSSTTAWADKGAHIFASGGDLTLVRSQLTGGRAGRGGAIYVDDSLVRAQNALWTDNHANIGGGGVWVEQGDIEVRYATLYGNSAPTGGALAVGSGKADLRASIIAGSAGGAIHLITTDGSAAFTGGMIWEIEGSPWLSAGVSTDSAPTGAPGVGQVMVDPRFVDTRNKDYTLRARSPGIDAGPLGGVDPDGTRADIGAYGGTLAWPLADFDGDGFTAGRDCDDRDASINEGAQDRPYDGIDSDCAFDSDYDQDGDGVDAVEFGGLDCDDTTAAITPRAAETEGDLRDADCDGLINPDLDGDGWESTLDCDDLDSDARPDAEERWYDGVDGDCSGGSDFDQDGDGFDSAAYGGTDCDDTNARIHRLMADETEDGVDNNCDGEDGKPATPETDDGSAEQLEGTTAPSDRVDPDRAALDETSESGKLTSTGCSTTGERGGRWGALAMGLGLLAALRRRR